VNSQRRFKEWSILGPRQSDKTFVPFIEIARPPEERVIVPTEVPGKVHSGFAYIPNNGPYEIYTIKPDGTDMRRVTRNNRVDYGPTWSPDGKRIAFHSAPPDHQTSTQIFTIRTDGKKVRRLTNPTTTKSAWNPDWSPDGSKLVFERHTKQYAEIVTIDRDGSHLRRLTHSKGGDYDPAWSPDGSRIVWNRALKTKLAIFTMNPDGSGVSSRLTMKDDRCPDWGPRPN
jgi:Tol biopolymer transport system component